jgi:hypothetical protein
LDGQAFSKTYQEYTKYKLELELLEKRERIERDLQRIEWLRDKEQVVEDYDLEPLISNLVLPTRSMGCLGMENMQSDSDCPSSSSDEMPEEEKEFY